MTQPSQAAIRLATQIASRAETCRFVRAYDSPTNPDPESARIAYIEWLSPLIDTEFRDLVEALRAWSDYFAELERISTPGDALAKAREEYHGKRLRQTRAALANHEAQP